MNKQECFCLDSRYSTCRMVTRKNPPELKEFLLLPRSHRRAEGGLRGRGYFKKGSPDKPLITVITIVYNGCQYIASTIESVLVQRYDNVEYIIIDGGSTDDTLDVVGRYEHAIDYWISEPDEGIADAFNKGLMTSTGQWLNFMNCGDRFAYPHAVEDVVEKVDETADVIYGKANVVDGKGKTLLTAGRPFDGKKFLRGRMIPHQSAFHNRRYFQRYGLFDKRLKMAMVYELLLRKRPLSTVFIDKTVSNMLVGGVHETEDYLRLKEVRMVREKYCTGLASSIVIDFDYCHALGRALIKRTLNRVGLGYVTRRIRQIESRLK